MNYTFKKNRIFKSYYLINGSKFYGFGSYFENETNFKNNFNALKSEHKKATHICYGYVYLNQNKQILSKSFDDNEPKNTAGKMILNALNTNHFINSFIIIVRYKNKTNLGIGLLARSYFQTCELLLKDKNNFELYETDFTLIINFKNQTQYSMLLDVFKLNQIQILNNHQNQIAIIVKANQLKLIVSKLNELNLNYQIIS